MAALVMAAASAVAQDNPPLIAPIQRRTPRKKDLGPRAVGLIQLGSDGKASIVPIAILINGKLWDASAYKADPIPMALETGTVYEGERTGNSLGLFTVGSALRSNNPDAAIPWLGTGVWRSNATAPPEKPAKAETVPKGIDADSGPPRLVRDTNANKPATSPNSTTAPSSTAPSSSPSPQTPQPSSGSGDGPPRLSRGTPSPDQTPNPPATSNAPTSEQSSPNDSKTGGNKGNDNPTDAAKQNRANVPASDSGASDANRPRLRRGKPEESFADQDIPGYSLPGVKPANAANTGKVVETLAANKANVQLIPAISDAGGPIPRSFGFEWIPGEEEDRRKELVDLAKDELRTYVATKLAATKSTTSEASSTPRKAAPRQVAARKLPDPILENMQVVTYDLWASNQPIMILSAQAHMPAATNWTTSVDPELQYSIVLVAYPDTYHNLHKLYSGITDKYHLDMTPRLELIDAVDADGDGYGELLFRETTDQGSGWAIYRASADKLWKMFDSLNPE